ncbi:MAG: hypothetical protein FXF54_09720 [Kosmotoga sp.]|nr:MAG: hypothetical protein FXF54_09720 [Kosmotoga sp.]
MQHRTTKDLHEMIQLVRQGWDIETYTVDGRKVAFHLFKKPGTKWSNDPKIDRENSGNWANDE